MTGITDDGLVELNGFAKLEFLSISYTAVTDAGLAHLHGLKNLKRLRIEWTNTTAAGIAELKRVLPQLDVVADHGKNWKAPSIEWDEYREDAIPGTVNSKYFQVVR